MNFRIKSRSGVRWCLELGATAKTELYPGRTFRFVEAKINETSEEFKFQDEQNTILYVNNNGEYRNTDGDWIPAGFVFTLQ